ncbi:flavin monoamine oxidase family protein [Lichenicoccus sp.]|uniref:flavin monoamine oxidase family protein n=1 Tax=Lichenicoccus sp. TaxID=2781899 RepID=UPI003D11040C
MSMTRRDWIMGVGLAGGFGAAQIALQGLGLETAHAETRLPALAPGSGAGRHVVILGAGIAGMTAAHELRRAGYHCTVLEARDRVGGKSWTIRGGDEVRFTDGRTQACRFDEGQYFNAGPGRIPSHHTALIGYCRAFGVPLEVEINSNHNAAVQDNAVYDGKPMTLRRVWTDTRGHVSELLAKSVNQHALDQSITAEDRSRMIDFLRQYGDLSPELLYKGSPRAGYVSLPGAADDAGVIEQPLPMDVLLDAGMWHGIMFDELFVMQTTMLQPVGGMDRIAKAFAHRLGGAIRTGCIVTRIARTGAGVTISYTNEKSRRTHAVEADLCLCTIPLAVLSNIPSDFSPDVKRAIAAPGSHMRQKMAFQGPRFWERDYHVYGGISYLKSPDAVIWHPSGDLMSDQGVLVLYGGEKEISPQPLDRQADLARAAIDAIYPGHAASLTRPVSVTWGNIPYSLGTGAVFTPATQWAYERLNKPDGPFFFAADYLTNVNGWQEGAIRSAYHAIAAMAGSAATAAL